LRRLWMLISMMRGLKSAIRVVTYNGRWHLVYGWWWLTLCQLPELHRGDSLHTVQHTLDIRLIEQIELDKCWRICACQTCADGVPFFALKSFNDVAAEQTAGCLSPSAFGSQRSSRIHTASYENSSSHDECDGKLVMIDWREVFFVVL